MTGAISDSVDMEISDPCALGNRPLVSVLMLAYNHGPYLAQAIESVVEQAASVPLELIIGEDGSTDDTKDIALGYQRRHPEIIRIITASQNVGLFRNYRRVLKASRGKYLAHIDGDDYWLPGKLAKQVEFMLDNQDVAAVYSNALTVDESGQNVGIFNNVGNERFDLAAMLHRGNFLNTSSMLFRADLRSTLLHIAEVFIDYRIHLRLARHGYLSQLKEPLAVYRIGAVGSMTTRSKDLVRKLYWDAITDVPRSLVTDSQFAHGVANFLRRTLSGSIRERRWDLFREWVPRALAASPFGLATTLLLAFGSAMRATGFALAARCRAGTRPRILHRR